MHHHYPQVQSGILVRYTNLKGMFSQSPDDWYVIQIRLILTPTCQSDRWLRKRRITTRRLRMQLAEDLGNVRLPSDFSSETLIRAPFSVTWFVLSGVYF